jgi:hypothetical protein
MELPVELILRGGGGEGHSQPMLIAALAVPVQVNSYVSKSFFYIDEKRFQRSLKLIT